MTDQPPSQQPPDEQEGPVPAPIPPTPAYTSNAPGSGGAIAGWAGSPFPADRPEIGVGAAFAGGLVLALILKRLAR